MYDLYSPDDDEEKQRAIAALASGTTGHNTVELPQVDITADRLPPEEQAPIAALAREAEAVPSAGAGDTAMRHVNPSLDVSPPVGDYHAPPAADGSDSPGLNGWAIAADLVFNRGRGLGQIISMAEQQKRDALKTKAAGKDTAAELALRKRGLDLQEHGQQLTESAQAARAAALTGKTEQGTKDADAMREHIKSVLGEEALVGLEDASPATLRAFMTQFNVDQRLKRAPELNAAAADRAGGVKQAVLDVEHGNTPRTAEDKGIIAGAQAEARLPSAKASKASPNYEQSINAAGGMTPEQERAASEEFTNKTTKQQEIAHSLKAIDDIMKRYPKGGVPGLGAGASMTPDWVRGLERAYDSARGNNAGVAKDDEAQTVSDALSNLSKAVLNKESGAVFHPSEEQATKIRTGSGIGRSEEQAKEAINLIREMNNGSLATHGVGREAVARKVLQAAGLDPSIIKDSTPVAAPKEISRDVGGKRGSAEERQNLMGPDYLKQLQADDEDLGVTYGR